MKTTKVPTKPTTPLSGWLKVLVVTFGSFIMVTSEFLPVGLLTRISADIHRSPGELGLMVTAPGLAAAITAPLALLLLHRRDRRYILVGLMLLIALADFLVATVSSFGLILMGRILLGAAVGGFWASRHESGESVRLLRTYPELRLVSPWMSLLFRP